MTWIFIPSNCLPAIHPVAFTDWPVTLAIQKTSTDCFATTAIALLAGMAIAHTKRRTHVDSPTINTISLFSGVGMLDEGLHAGLGFMGIRSRTVMYAEREAYPVAVLEARMQEGSIPDAPIWFGDLCELDAIQFSGVVDCVVAGFPCQDLSLAGRRAGLDGKRSGLFFEVVRIARDCGARYLFLENVGGIASATATVVDETEGALEERAAARVLGELADLGWHAEWATISASDVGASHGRARWFCWAWRGVADASSGHGRELARSDQRGLSQPHGGTAEASTLDNTVSNGWGARRVPDGCHDRHVVDATGALSVGEPESIRRPARRAEHAWQQRRTAFAVPGGEVGHPGLQHQHIQQREDGAEHSGAGGDVECEFCAHEYPEHLGRYGCPNCEGRGLDDLANASQPGLPNTEQQNTDGAWRRHEGRTAPQLCGAPLFAPGPTDPTWPGIIARQPWLAPALSIEEQHNAQAAFAEAQSDVCREPHGMASRLDFDARAQRLKCCGNGVVAAQASFALVGLVRRMREFQ